MSDDKLSKDRSSSSDSEGSSKASSSENLFSNNYGENIMDKSSVPENFEQQLLLSTNDFYYTSPEKGLSSSDLDNSIHSNYYNQQSSMCNSNIATKHFDQQIPPLSTSSSHNPITVSSEQHSMDTHCTLSSISSKKRLTSSNSSNPTHRNYYNQQSSMCNSNIATKHFDQQIPPLSTSSSHNSPTVSFEQQNMNTHYISLNKNSRKRSLSSPSIISNNSSSLNCTQSSMYDSNVINKNSEQQLSPVNTSSLHIINDFLSESFQQQPQSQMRNLNISNCVNSRMNDLCYKDRFTNNKF
ncbi:hypothetical protein [Wolbachia endosymbiont of Chironomus riparius]|uniref:hypothetical protein n=1 Tax=Wolbachia endosymbiont of Chironomus riparius TaxID=2883238 RepID=UPI00209FDDE6|nr:hypothetical protein [Wolbachia endosymbiont of Chironomus riparius]